MTTTKGFHISLIKQEKIRIPTDTKNVWKVKHSTRTLTREISPELYEELSRLYKGTKMAKTNREFLETIPEEEIKK
jgi:hypothetical protein